MAGHPKEARPPFTTVAGEPIPWRLGGGMGRGRRTHDVPDPARVAARSATWRMSREKMNPWTGESRYQ